MFWSAFIQENTLLLSVPLLGMFLGGIAGLGMALHPKAWKRNNSE